MITQKLLSLKLDSDLSDHLDLFCSDNRIKRNSLINFAVMAVLENLSSYSCNKILADKYNLFSYHFENGLLIYD